jgi:hypothetical protein
MAKEEVDAGVEEGDPGNSAVRHDEPALFISQAGSTGFKREIVNFPLEGR